MVLVTVEKVWSNDLTQVVEEDYRVKVAYQTPEDMHHDAEWMANPSIEDARVLWDATRRAGRFTLSEPWEGLPELRLLDEDWPEGAEIHHHLNPTMTYVYPQGF